MIEALQEEDCSGGGDPLDVGELASQVQDTLLPAHERLRAVHALLEGCLNASIGAELRLLTKPAFIGAVLDLLAGVDRLQLVPVKLLGCIALAPEASGALESLDALGVVLAVLRAADEPLLVGASAALVASVASEPKAARRLCGQAGSVRVLIRLLWSWCHDPEVVLPLLSIFDRALRLPVHRAVLGSRVAVAGEEAPVGLVPALRRLPGTSGGLGGMRVDLQRWASSLAREWEFIALSIGDET